MLSDEPLMMSNDRLVQLRFKARVRIFAATTDMCGTCSTRLLVFPFHLRDGPAKRTTMMVEDILKALSIGIITFYLLKLLSFLLQPYTSPLRDVPGPPSSSWFLGNINNIHNSQPAVLQEAWTDKYGKTIHYKGWFNVRRLLFLSVESYQPPFLDRGTGCIPSIHAHWVTFSIIRTIISSQDSLAIRCQAS